MVDGSSEVVGLTSVQMRRSEEGVCEGVDSDETGVELAESLNDGLRLVELVLSLEVVAEVSSGVVEVKSTAVEVDSTGELVLVAFSAADSSDDKNDLSREAISSSFA